MALASKRKKSKKKNTMESAAFQRDEIILWVVLAFSIILCLSNFGIGGSVGNKLSSVFFGLFGLVSYIFPIGLVLLTAFGPERSAFRGMQKGSQKVYHAAKNKKKIPDDGNRERRGSRNVVTVW